MVLSPLTADDLDEVLAIESDLFGAEHWTRGMFRSELDHGHYYLAARDGDGTILGYGGVAVLGEEAWLNNLAVTKPAQRRGVGTALLTALLAEVERRGARSVLLEVAADNGPAQRLYDRFGFVPVSVRRGYYQPSDTDAVVMRRDG